MNDGETNTKVIEPSNRMQNMIDLAIRTAKQSDFNEQFRHCAILFSGGRIINIATNKSGFSSFGRRFNLGAKKIPAKASLHAELRCLLNVDRDISRDASILVIRINKKGELRMSKPCNMCSCLCEYMGIRKVFYSNENGQIEFWRLS